MINYAKIKYGKGLTRNQKRLRDVYLQHKYNLEGEEIEIKFKLNGHNVRLYDGSYADIKCSRKVRVVSIAYDGLQKENVRVVVEEKEKRDWGRGYIDRWDEIYIVLGKKNIIYHKYNHSLRPLRLYDNNGVCNKFFVEINHRKKDNEISFGPCSYMDEGGV